MGTGGVLNASNDFPALGLLRPVHLCREAGIGRLADTDLTAVIQGDLREPAKILADPETQLLLDFTQPVAVFLVAVLHFLPDTGQAPDIVATLRDALAPGSYLVICHACRDEQPSLATS